MRYIIYFLSIFSALNTRAAQEYFVKGVTKTYNIAEVMHFMGAHNFHMDATMIGDTEMPFLSVAFSTSPKSPETPDYIKTGEYAYEYLEQFTILACSSDPGHQPIMTPAQCKTLEIPWTFLAVHSFYSVSFNSAQRRIVVKGKRYVTEGFKEIKLKEPESLMELKKFELIVQFQAADDMTKISAIATLKDL